MNLIQYPAGKYEILKIQQSQSDASTDQYIIQISRFDPSKGIMHALEAYKKFHRQLSELYPRRKVPKLLICGNGSIDDPDGSIVYDAALRYIMDSMSYLAGMICVMRLSPSDQILNTLLSKAHIVLQLSSQEGFEVKVSEALHKGKPVIATRAGGIPLQLDHGRTGYLVDVGDTDSVAQYMLDLWTDHNLYDRMSANSSRYACDEISTVGNALNWLFLSCKLSRGETLQLNQRWIQDLARMDFGRQYDAAEKRLKRSIG